MSWQKKSTKSLAQQICKSAQYSMYSEIRIHIGPEPI